MRFGQTKIAKKEFSGVKNQGVLGITMLIKKVSQI